jgi:hypothetical protein
LAQILKRSKKEVKEYSSKKRELCKDLCSEICTIFDKRNLQGSNGSEGSTDGIIADQSCRVLYKEMEIDEKDVFLDIGSSSGLTVLARISALSDCIGLGIEEVEQERQNVAMTFLKALLASNLKDMQMAVLHEDVKNATTFNGVSKILMFDKVFTSALMGTISFIFIKSRTVKFIASTRKDFKDFGFAVNKRTSDASYFLHI